MKRRILVLFASALASFAQQTHDLVVYGGTAGGVITAVSGAREGLKVALLPKKTRGGTVDEAVIVPAAMLAGMSVCIRLHVAPLYE